MTGQYHSSASALIAHAEPVLAKYGYAGIFVANFFESFGIPLPGQTLLMAGALLALEGRYDIAQVVGVAFCASFLGACLGFAVGRLGGRALIARVPIDQKHLLRIESMFARYGWLVVLLSRFLDGFRQLTPLVAGSLAMRPLPFILASLMGSALWAGAWGYGVYLLGPDFHELLLQLKQLSPLSWALALLMIALLAWLLFRRREG